MSHNFLIRKIGAKEDIAHIIVPAALDSQTAYDLLDRIKRLSQTGMSKYIINLEDAQYISSTGIEILFRLQREYGEQYGTVLVTNIPEKIIGIFEKVGAMILLEIAETLEKAVERLTA
ncbi:hypothetical protein U14_02033 [Candidatus Moduliflexus flocculans]|uniref:STAS domain-containing protein n=1 Tax=Candidatus Moduliflexus flocculans TaxID=1499966 RepID=A0A0S6VTD1_9BACT|nr:hypothetical protein U14_02033 [Candidatus Moduliflexus flocculans]